MQNMQPETVWIGAFVTIAVLSYLIRDNYLYRLVQHAALGVAIGITTVLLWQNVLYPRWYLPILQGWRALSAAPGTPVTGSGAWGLLWLLALVPGGLWYFQLSRKYAGLSTLVSGMFVGAAAGLAIKYQTVLILPQLSASILPLNPVDSATGQMTGASVGTALNNLLFVVILLTALLYFFFSIRTDRVAFRGPLRFGRLAIMTCLGAMFGGTVLTRIAYLLERIVFLYETWLTDNVLAMFR